MATLRKCSRPTCTNMHSNVHPWCSRCRHKHNRTGSWRELSPVRDKDQEIEHCKQQIDYWTKRLEDIAKSSH